MSDKCTIRFMGDVMIGRFVNNKTSEHGFKYPWGNILPILKQDGVNIINLETTLTISKKRYPKAFNFKADPDKVNALVEANIHLASIANNHIFDYAVEGMMETVQILDQSRIIHTGAGSNLDEAKKPAIILHNNLRIGVIGCTDNEPSWQANKYPGTFYVKVGNLQSLKETIQSSRKQVDILILSIHWGPNMVEKPDRKQIQFAHKLIELGVDIIHGHSAHIFQGIEIYKGKLILYDTGDFVDDYAVDAVLRNDKSFLYECEISDKKITALNLIPVIIRDMQVNLAEGQDKSWAITRVQFLSSPFGTQILDSGEVII